MTTVQAASDYDEVMTGNGDMIDNMMTMPTQAISIMTRLDKY